MAVDEAGHRDLAVGVDALGVLRGGDVASTGPAVTLSIAAAPYDDGGVLDEADLFLIVVHEGGAAGDDEIGREIGRGTSAGVFVPGGWA